MGQRRAATVTGSALVGVVLSGCGGSTGKVVDAPRLATTTAPTTTTVPPTTTAPAPTTIFTQTGNGVVSTRSFTVPSNWSLNWAYKCDPSVFDTGLTVYVNQGPGQGTAATMNDAPLLQNGPSGTGTQYYYYGGTVYLQIVSGCDWAVVAATP